ncbi:anaerobic ribonucleoside-triphosphate reductase activating protein [Treponema sp. Marseille-Q3903]|jgi:anaerobic ribonucleoside-triphosphate reductase activating protein|uniref:anaerobic ribonucleoside-triphosphate reductase activating protein n=1 Tax=Treponema sp. Marseille-Q3903 TaxID=2766703 RepID=UPI00165291B2|nr:anaerobic ribonucleoside-triphosphate reductase activating protein [Treponema sp. Marseille-Q3903]MBC6712679.1 anaerobic ribonucleoside-triphosphate reductase activating protein [Treponema sp. Marseille-Q3903]
MYYGKIKKSDIADGHGVRVSLFVSGCRNRCPGCFNKETWSFTYGKEFTDDTMNEILEALKPDYIKGFSILGGEIMEEENQPKVLEIIQRVRKEFPQKDIWAWTGYVYDRDLVEGGRKYIKGITDEIINNIDVLVDGPFIAEKKDISLQYCGSLNQRVLKIGQINKNSILVAK